MFADRLTAAVRATGTPLMVGLDPRLESLPEGLRPGGNAGLAEQAEAYRRFCCEVLDAVAGTVGVVKPQAAFFEQLGPLGMVALGRVIEHARSHGLLVVLDGKRNDIGTTATAYAEAYLGATSPWGCDALTVSPYLGEDSLTPFVATAKQRDAGLFVLVKTSNPGGGLFQDLQASANGGNVSQSVYRHVGALVERLASETLGECGYGAVGAVVGATYPEQLAELRAALPHTWFLVPGYGAQGGSADDVLPAFDARGLGAIVNSSRGVIFAYQQRAYAGLPWQEAVAAAARDSAAQLPRVAG